MSEHRSQQRSKWGLIAVLVVAGACLSAAIFRAMSVRSVLSNSDLMSDVWFQVTLLDAYLGFIIFYAWVAWRESSQIARVVWFVLMMSLGNLAACAYLILQLWRLPAGRPISDIVRGPS